MPTILISAIFWQVTFCAVIWTLEKRYKKKCWCHVCFSKKVFVPEGHMTRRSSRKARDLASGWGEGWRYRKHSALQECPVSMQAVAHLGRHSRPRLTGSSLKHKGGSLETQLSLCLANKRPSSLLWFLFLQLVVSKPLPGIVRVLPELMFFPPSKKKNDSAHMWHLRIGLFWMNKKERVWYNSWWGVCVFFFMPQFVNCNCGFPLNCLDWAEIKKKKFKKVQ